MHKNRVELEGMLEDPLFTVVFVMEYLLGEPMAERDRRVSCQCSSFREFLTQISVTSDIFISV